MCADSSIAMHLIYVIIFYPICNYHLLSAHYVQVTSKKVLFIWYRVTVLNLPQGTAFSVFPK